MSKQVKSIPPGDYARNCRIARVYWIAACAMISAFFGFLLVVTVMRISFPWDLYVWPESPFLTNMLKLAHGQPIYSAPADGNSFIYSPGMEYLCYALLKPFGCELDIRFCRVVSVLIGIVAAGSGTLAIRRVVPPAALPCRPWLFTLVTWSVLWLALSKNFMSDVVHPDNLHALHALLVFLLCLAAAQMQNFGLAIAAMFVAGIGVFAKQTEAACLLGPAAVFAILHPWGWRRWLLLLTVGLLTLCISLYLLWLPTYGRFFTLDLPSRQGIDSRKVLGALRELFSMHRGTLQILAIIAAWQFWNSGTTGRRYLICWVCIGCFAVLPSLAAYLKIEGGNNNLFLFRVWLLLLVWPMFASLLTSVRTYSSGGPSIALLNRPLLIHALCLLTLLSLVWLLPAKRPPLPGHFRYCEAIENSVRQDLKAGRRVLVAHGTEFLIRAGSRDVPLDRSISLLEMNVGHVGGLANMDTRLRSHYYDRIYLVVGQWYGESLLEEVRRHYKVVATENQSSGAHYNWPQGYQPELMTVCQVLEPVAR